MHVCLAANVREDVAQCGVDVGGLFLEGIEGLGQCGVVGNARPVGLSRLATW